MFRRTRVTVGLMTAAKLLSAVEPILRYQRGRFRGGEAASPGSPRYELGLQQKEDALHRLVDIWATGEAGASLGFAAARLFDELDPLEQEKDAILAEHGIRGGTRGNSRRSRRLQDDVLELARVSRAGRKGPRRTTLRVAQRRPARAVHAARLAGQRAVPGGQALEHRATART